MLGAVFEYEGLVNVGLWFGKRKGYHGELRGERLMRVVKCEV